MTSDPLAADDTDGSINSQHARISERRSNSSSDIHGRGDISLPIIPKQKKIPREWPGQDVRVPHTGNIWGKSLHYYAMICKLLHH